MSALFISCRPVIWISRSMWLTRRFNSSCVIGNFWNERRRPVSIFSLLYGSCRPSRLMTVRFRISVSSMVEKRKSQRAHSRRRRIAIPSSMSRESMTRVSSLWQAGHFIAWTRKQQPLSLPAMPRGNAWRAGSPSYNDVDLSPRGRQDWCGRQRRACPPMPSTRRRRAGWTPYECRRTAKRGVAFVKEACDKRSRSPPPLAEAKAQRPSQY